MISSRRIEVRGLASGATLEIRVYTVKGTDPGAPTAYVQSSMHGSEVQGNAVIAALLDHFTAKPPAGDVVLVPNANPFAVNQKSGEYTLGRFDPTTGANWNRNYWLPRVAPMRELPWPELCRQFRGDMLASISARLSYNLAFAEKMALTLQSLALAADYVIDLHCANVSVRHLYAPAYAEDCARYFQIPLILSIPNGFDGALDEAQSCSWWSLWESLQAAGYAGLPSLRELPQGFTLELGGQERISRAEAGRDAGGILNFLRHKGVVAGAVRQPEPAFLCTLADYRTIYSRHAGHTDYTAVLGEVSTQGTELAQTLQFAGTAEWVPTVAEEDCIPILHHSSAVIHQGSELMKVFTRFRRV